MKKESCLFMFFLVLLIGCRQPEPPIRFEQLSASLQKDEDAHWILQILNYESCCGSASGSGLPYWGMFNDQPPTIDSAFNCFRVKYLPRVKKYPLGVRERLGDYYFNTGRSPEQLLMFAAGYLTLDQINSKQRFQEKWKVCQSAIQMRFNDPAFLFQLDSAKEKVYQTTHMEDGKTNPAYERTWKKRTWMWSKQINPVQ